ncbi:MAG: hypothetical protein R3F37_19255 [Candidatus Competibacteraceae bacterium]
MEARLLLGDANLFERMKQLESALARCGTEGAFFRAKKDEQAARYRKSQGTAYNLEPNVKESPGGLRDLQMIGCGQNVISMPQR